MNDHEPGERDYWDAEYAHLSIEGYRLIAQDITYEVKLLGRWLAGWWYGAFRRRTTP